MTRLAQTMTALAIIAFALPAAIAQDNDHDELAQIIQVTSEGKATAPPDMATINTGVTTQAEKARTALDESNAIMKKLLAILKEHEVAEKDVQTSNFSVQPVYERNEEGQTEPKVIAYRVENQVQIRVRNLDSLGTVLDALVSAGSNRISGISFGIDDPDDVLNEARRKAITDARQRAQVYAKTASVIVGPIVQITEQAILLPPPRPMRGGRMAFAAEAANVPIATGEQEFHVTINVAYELRQPDGE